MVTLTHDPRNCFLFAIFLFGSLFGINFLGHFLDSSPYALTHHDKEVTQAKVTKCTGLEVHVHPSTFLKEKFCGRSKFLFQNNFISLQHLSHLKIYCTVCDDKKIQKKNKKHQSRKSIQITTKK
jgi:hypothetical protein